MELQQSEQKNSLKFVLRILILVWRQEDKWGANCPATPRQWINQPRSSTTDLQWQKENRIKYSSSTNPYKTLAHFPTRIHSNLF